MSKRNWILLVLLCIFYDVAQAQVREIRATGEFRMGDNDTRADAKRLALLDARRRALEQVGTYVQSLTEVRNFRLTRDEITTYSAGIMEILEETTKGIPDGETTVVHVDIVARIDTGVLLAQLRVLQENQKAMTELRELRAEMEQLRQQLDAQTKQLKTLQSKSEIDAVTEQRQKTLNKMDAFESALYYQRRGDYRKAIEQYTSMLEKDSLNASVYNNLGLAHLSSQNYPEAIKAFRQAILVDPNYDKAHNNLGTALIRAGQDTQAEREFSRALELNPKNSEAMTNLAILVRKSGKLSEAKTLYLRALQVNPSNPETHYNLALTYEEEGDFERAIEHFGKFLNLGSASYPDIVRDVQKKIEEISRRKRPN